MATASSTAESETTDPSEFAISVAVGYAHVLDRVLGFLERASSARVVSPVVAVSLALPVLVAYLLVVALAFTVRVAAGSYAHVALGNNGRSSGGLPALAVAMLHAAVVNLAVYLVVMCALDIGPLLCFASVQCRARWS